MVESRSLNGSLIRYRGVTRQSDIEAESFKPVNTVDYFNLVDETWSTQTSLAEPWNDHFHRHIFISEVIYKLAP